MIVLFHKHTHTWIANIKKYSDKGRIAWWWKVGRDHLWWWDTYCHIPHVHSMDTIQCLCKMILPALIIWLCLFYAHFSATYKPRPPSRRACHVSVAFTHGPMYLAIGGPTHISSILYYYRWVDGNGRLCKNYQYIWSSKWFQMSATRFSCDWKHWFRHSQDSLRLWHLVHRRCALQPHWPYSLSSPWCYCVLGFGGEKLFDTHESLKTSSLMHNRVEERE